MSPPFLPRVLLIPSCRAVFGLMSAALSQVSLVSGFGNSCNQPLLAKRPSKIVGSARKITSRVLGAGGSVLDALSELAQSDFSETVFGGNAVLGINPSCRHFRHQLSKS